MTTNNITTETDASALVAAMRARGIRFVVYRKRNTVDVVLRPYRLVTDADREALRAHWEVICRLVVDESARAAEPTGGLGDAERPTIFPAQPSAQPPGSVAPPAARRPDPAREPSESDRAALDRWCVEVRPGRAPRAVEPGNTATLYAFLRRTRDGGSTWQP